MANNILPIRRTLAAGETFCVVNCARYVVQNLSTTNSMYIRNLLQDGNEDSTEVKPGVAYNDPGSNSANQSYAQVIFDGSNLAGDAAFTVVAIGKIQDPPFDTAEQLVAAGYL